MCLETVQCQYTYNDLMKSANVTVHVEVDFVCNRLSVDSIGVNIQCCSEGKYLTSTDTDKEDRNV